MYCPNFNDEFYKELKRLFGKEAVYLFNSRLMDEDVKHWITKDVKIYIDKDNVIIENAYGSKWNFKEEIDFYTKNNKEEILSEITNTFGEIDTKYIYNKNLSLEDNLLMKHLILDFAKKLKDRIGIKLEIDTSIREDLESKTIKGKIFSNKSGETIVRINLAYANLDTPIHEILAHPIIRYIKTEKQQLYDNFIKELNNSEIGRKILNKIEEEFGKEYEFKEEEAIVELLTKYINNELDKVDEKGIISVLKEILNTVKEFVKKIILGDAVVLDELPDNLTLRDLAQILTYSNSPIVKSRNEINFVTPDGKVFKTFESAIDYIERIRKENLKNREIITIEDIKETVDKKIESIRNDLEYYLYLKNIGDIKNFPIDEFYIDVNERIRSSTELRHYLYYDKYKVVVDRNKGRVLLYLIRNGEEIFDTGFTKYFDLLELYKISLINKHGETINFAIYNNEFEIGKKTIEEVKKELNIEYNPEEAYEYGYVYSHLIGAYTNAQQHDILSNLLENLHVFEKEGLEREYLLSCCVHKVDKFPLDDGINKDKVYIRLYPEKGDIKEVYYNDTYTGSLGDSYKLAKNATFINASYYAAVHTKSPAGTLNLKKLATSIDNVINHVNKDNELVIRLRKNNFRIVYEENVPYEIKLLADKINNILDKKYGVKEITLGNKEVREYVSNYDRIIIDETVNKHLSKYRILYSSTFDENNNFVTEYYYTKDEYKYVAANTEIEGNIIKSYYKIKNNDLSTKEYIDREEFVNNSPKFLFLDQLKQNLKTILYKETLNTFRYNFITTIVDRNINKQISYFDEPLYQTIDYKLDIFDDKNYDYSSTIKNIVDKSNMYLYIKDLPVYSDKGVNTLRIFKNGKLIESFGNPFVPNATSYNKNKNVLIPASKKFAAKFYKDWLLKNEVPNLPYINAEITGRLKKSDIADMKFTIKDIEIKPNDILHLKLYSPLTNKTYDVITDFFGNIKNKELDGKLTFNNKYGKFLEPQRKWILEQINSGKLDGKKLLYFKESDVEYSHADALAEVIYELREGKVDKISNDLGYDKRIGKYVEYKGKTYIITKINSNNTIQIISKDNNKLEKLSVSEKNLKYKNGNSTIVRYKNKDYIVTEKGSIISLTTNKFMEWGDENGDRREILKLAKYEYIADKIKDKVNIDKETIKSTLDSLENNTGTSVSDTKILEDSVGKGFSPKILVASEASDPVFHADKIKELVNRRKELGISAMYLITKHDGLPLKELAKLPIPKFYHFSITTLGGTKYEPGVMKYNDFLDRIETFIKEGIINPNLVTIRIDPIIPNVTKFEDIEIVLKRAKEMGINKIKFSVLDTYANSKNDRYIIEKMQELGYDFSAYESKDGISFHAKQEVINEIAIKMKELCDKYNIKEISTCAERINVPGIQKLSCLNVQSINAVLGRDDIAYIKGNQRPECSCYGNKIDALRYNDKCASSCVYCYAGHNKDKNIEYYDENGNLKDNIFTRTVEKEIENKSSKINTINYVTYPSIKYADRTRYNVENSDITLAFAADFSTQGEKVTESFALEYKKQYKAIDISKKEIKPEDIKDIVEKINSIGKDEITINIAGNGIYSLKHIFSQEELDSYIYTYLKKIIEHPDLKAKVSIIRSGGQTGVDEAGAKAGVLLGFNTIITTTSDYRFRDIEGKDISGKSKFIERFEKLDHIKVETYPEKVNTIDENYDKKIDNYKNKIKEELIEGFTLEDIESIKRSLLPSVVQEYITTRDLSSALDVTFSRLENTLNNLYILKNKNLENLTDKERQFANFYNITDITKLDELIKNYELVINNRFLFNRFFKENSKKLSMFAKSFEDEKFLNYTDRDIDENVNSIYRELDKGYDEINLKDTATIDFKLFLHRIRDSKYDENGKIVYKINKLGLPEFVDADYLYKRILKITSSAPLGFENKINALREEAKTDSVIAEFLDKLLTNADPSDVRKYDYYNKIRNEFEILFDVSNVKHELILYLPQKTKNGLEYNKYIRFNSNSGDGVRALLDSWTEGFIHSDFTKELSGLKYGFNIDKLREFKTSLYNEFRELFNIKDEQERLKKQDELVLKFFNKIGINIPEFILNKIKSVNFDGYSYKDYFNPYSETILKDKNKIAFSVDNKNYIENSDSFISKFFDHFEDIVNLDIEEGISFDIYNPINPQKSRTLINVFRKLAKVYFNASPTAGSLSYFNVNGDKVYSIQLNTDLTIRLDELRNNPEYREKLKNISFSKDSLILKDFDNNEDISITFLDGFNRLYSKHEGKDRKKLNNLNQDIFAFNLLLQGSYIMLTHSDRKISTILNWKKHDIELPKFGKINDKLRVVGLDSSTKQLLRNVYKGELNRIVKFNNEIKDKMIEMGLDKSSYFKGADKFFLNPYFNYDSMRKMVDKKVITEDELNIVWYDGIDKDGKKIKLLNNSEESLNILDKVLEHVIVTEINKTFSNWFRRGMFKLSNDNKDIVAIKLPYNYLTKDNKIPFGGNLENKIKSILMAATDFVVNTTIANAEMYKVFYDDMAHFYTKSVQDTIDNYQKRLSKALSPHKLHNYESKQCRVITVKEFTEASKFAEKYKSLTNSDSYNKIDIADGQEFGTMLEAINTKYANGRLPKSIYDSIKAKIFKSYEDGTHYFELTPEERNYIFAPDKQVYVQTEYLPELDIMNPTFRKTSIFWLVPEITRSLGSDIDNIRIAMEKKGIDRLCCESGEKSGTLEAIDVKNIMNAEEGIHIRTLDRKGLGIQLDLPIHDEKYIRNISQADKFIFTDLDESLEIKIKDKIMTVKEIKDKKEEIVSRIYELGFKEVLEEFGIVNENSTLDNKLLKDAIENFIFSNNWDYDIIKSFQLDENGNFEIPLYLNPYSKQIEHAIMAMFRKNISNFKVPGFHSVAVSPFVLNKVIDFSELSTKEIKEFESKLVHIKGFDINNGLKHHTINEDGSANRAEVIISWNFRDKDGNILDIDKFTYIDPVDNKKYIDLRKIDEELLNVIVARIPLQLPSNMSAAKVVGFLPAYLGDIMIASKETIKQMGHDFDFDEFHNYRKNYYFDGARLKVIRREDLDNVNNMINEIKTGIKDAKQYLKDTDEKVVKTASDFIQSEKEYIYEYSQINERNVLANEYIELFENILLDKNVINKVIQPLDKDDLKIEANIVKEKLKEENIPILWSYQRDSYNNQQIGKDLIAVSSLFGQFIVTIQNKNIKVSKDYEINMFKDKEGNQLILNNLSNVIKSEYNGEIRTKLINIATMQSLFTDYAKSPIGTYINLNDITAAPMMTLISLDDGKNIINLDYATRFITQPILKELVQYTKDKEINVFDVPKAINELLEKYDKNFVKEEGSFSIDELTEARDLGLKEDLSKITDKQFWKIQYNSLVTFKKLFEISKEINLARKVLLSPARSGGGKTFIDALILTKKSEKVINSKILEGLDKIYINPETGEYIPNQWTNASKYTVDEPLKIFKSKFPYNSKIFNSTISKLSNALNRDLYDREYSELWDELRNYIYSGNIKSFFGITSTEARKKLLHKDSPNNIVKRYYTLYKTNKEFRNNYFVNLIKTNSKREYNYLTITHNSIDELSYDKARAAFRDLIISEDKDIREFGKDLIIQQFLLGNFSSNNSYAKFIDVEILKELGVTEKLKEIDFDSDVPLIDVDMFVDQYIRNNSWKIKDISDLKNITSYEVKDNKLTVYTDIEDMLGIPEYIKITDIKGKEKIYRLIKDDYLSREYIEVPKLGEYNMPEYENGIYLNTLITDNKIDNFEIPTVFENKSKPNEVYEFKEDNKDYETTHSVLEYIRDNSDNKSYSLISEVLLKIAENIPIKLSTDKNFRGKYVVDKDEKYIEISTKGFYKNTSTEFDEVVLHEVIHSVFNKIFNEVIHEKTGLIKDTKLSEYSTKVASSIRGLYYIREQILNTIKDKNPELYNKLQKAFETDVYDKDIVKYYGLKNLKEFVSETLTNKDFQLFLNEIKIENKTFFQKVIDVLSDIILNIAKSLGFDVKDESALKYSLENIFILADELRTEKFKDNTNKEESKSVTIPKVESNYDDLDLVKLRDNIIKKLEFDLEFLNRRKTNAMNKDERLIINSYIVDIKDSINSLKQGGDLFEKIRVVAENQINSLHRILNKTSVTGDELKYATNIIDNWNYENSKEYLKDIDIEVNPGLNELMQTISNISSNYERKLLLKTKLWVKEEIKRITGKDISIKDLDTVKDVGFSSYFLDISRIDNDIARTIAIKLHNAARNSEALVSKLSREIREKLNKIKDKEKLKLLLEKDEKGNYTGRLISRYSIIWRKYITDKFREFENIENSFNSTTNNEIRENVVSSSLNNYYFNQKYGLNENTILIDYRFFVDNKHSTPDFKNRTEYENWLKKELETDDISEIINKSVERYNKYIKEKQEYLDNLKDMFEEIDVDSIIKDIKDRKLYGKLREMELYKKLSNIYSGEQLVEVVDSFEKYFKWEARNDVENYIEVMLNTKKIDKNNYYKIFVFENEYNYLLRIPKKYRNGEETNFYSDVYKELFKEENKDIKEYYDYHVSKTAEFLSYLPSYITKNLSNTFLAKVSKDFREIWTDSRFKGLLSYYNDKIINLICNPEIARLTEVKESDKVLRNPFTNEEVNLIPINYILNDLDISERSFNLPALLEILGSVAIHYKNKSSIENEVLLMNRILEEAKELKVKGKTSVIKGNNILTIDNKRMRIKESVKYAIEAALYDKTLAERKDSKIKLFSLNPIEQRIKAKKAKELEQKKEQYMKLDIDEALKDELISALDKEYKELEGRYIQTGKVIDVINKFTTLKGLALNLPSGINNLFFGVMSNLIYSNARVDFSTRDYLKAISIVMKAIITRKGLEKLKNLVSDYNILFEVNESRYGKTVTRQYRMLDKIDVMMFQTKTEFFNQVTSMVAQMLARKVMVNGKEIPLFYAYDEKGRLVEGIEEGWEIDINVTNNKFTEFRNKIIQINKKIHGNYDPNSFMEIKRYDLGRMLMIFRSWMPEGFASRFEAEKFDAELGRMVKGRYRTYADLGLVGSLKTLIKQIFYSKNAFIDKDGNPLKQVDIENMRKNLAEIVAFASILSLGSMIKAAISDDEEEHRLAFTIINALERTSQDVKFYISPTTFTQLLRDPIPVVATFRDFSKAIDSSIDYIKGKEFREGVETPIDKWAKAFPISAGIKRFIYQSENLYEDVRIK